MKTALIVIDMQNDYLYEKRKDIFSYTPLNLQPQSMNLYTNTKIISVILFTYAILFRIYQPIDFCLVIQ